MISWLFSLDSTAVYAGIFLLLMGGAFGLPIPEDIPLVLAGVLVHRGTADLLSVFLTCYVGILVGDSILFYFGRKLGKSAEKRDWLTSKVSQSSIDKAKRELEKRSFVAILIARHLFYFRTVTFLACGAIKMSFQRFIIADAFAALVSATLMISLGHMFSEQYSVILDLFKKTKSLLLWVSLIVLICVWVYIRKSRSKTASPLDPEQ